MLSISAIVKRKHGELTELPLIAKLPPLTNEQLWDIFQPERTCITENAIYQYLAPELAKLQLEAGIPENDLFDGFAQYYGSRISLDPNTNKVDRDAVLVLENLHTSGYRSPNRLIPFDLAYTLLSLKYMAQFHAFSIALRLTKPEVYTRYVRPFFKKFNMAANMTEKEYNDMVEDTLKDIRAVTDNNDAEVEHIKKLCGSFDAFQRGADVDDGPYTSIVHSDFWINNVMVKYAEDGTPLKMKIVDFQIAQHENVVHDIIFFLLSCIENPVLESNYELFLQSYYVNFIGCLKSLHLDTSNYNFDGFLAEVKSVGHIQVTHALFMTKVIMADNTTLPEDHKDLDLTLISKSNSPRNNNKVSDILRLTKIFNILDQ